MDLRSILSALPSAASSPYAFIAYLLVTAAWVVISLRVKRNRQLLDHLQKLPEADRLKALQLEMGAVQVRRGLTANQWLRSRLHLYYFLGFCMLCVAAVTVFAIAVTTAVSRPDPGGSQTALLAATAISGDWHAAFIDPDYAPGGNQFFFQFKPSGTNLFGTATRVYTATSDQAKGYPHALVEGKIQGNSISFWYTGENKRANGDGSYTPLRDMFTGTVSGDTIRFIYQVEGGNHPVEFIANRIPSRSR